MTKSNHFCFSCLALLIGIVLVMGCNRSASQRNATVQGTLTIDGELASSGTVTFHPVDGGPVATGQVQTDGSYSLSTGRGTTKGPNSGTVFPGKYQVTVMVTGEQDANVVVGEDGPPAAGPRLVAKKYTSKDSSGLEFEVKAGPNLFVLPVLGASHDPPEEDNVAGEDDATAEEESADSDTEAAAQEEAEVSEKKAVTEEPTASEEQENAAEETETEETPSESDTEASQ